MPRVAGHRGKGPAKRVNLETVDRYMRGAFPLPTTGDVTGGMTEWGMLGNGPDPTCTIAPNGVGDCGFAARQHNRMAKALSYGLTESWETSDQLVAEYMSYDRFVDQGVVIADVLHAWYTEGKIVAYAPVQLSPDQVNRAMLAFHGVIVGAGMPVSAEPQFEAEQIWTVTGPPEDGHVLVKMRYGPSVDAFCTWGAIQPADTAWFTSYVDEAWVIVTAEDSHQVDMDALIADIEALGGTADPTPAPTSWWQRILSVFGL